MTRYQIWARVPKGNGASSEASCEIEGDMDDARDALANLIEGLGVETAIEEIEPPTLVVPVEETKPGVHLAVLPRGTRRITGVTLQGGKPISIRIEDPNPPAPAGWVEDLMETEADPAQEGESR